jgi:nitrous oxidase accessory protein NosD
MKNLLALAAFVALVTWSCQKDAVVQNSETDPTVLAQCQADAFKQLENTHKTWIANGLDPLSKNELEVRSAAFVVVNANSTNVLAQAIRDAGEGGTVYLRAGLHTETQTITVPFRVIIIGENGAILKIKSALSPFDPVAVQIVLKPAIHVFNAAQTLIQNIDIQPLDSDGACAILLENASESAVMGCKISKFQFSVWVQKSDKTVLMRNTVVGTSAWQTVEGVEAEGITIENGKSAYIADNDISNCVFGIWPCDQYGTAERNTFKGCLYGLVLCNVPLAYIMPSGERTGSLTPGNNWKVRNNNSTDNIQAGYLVIDGANNNLLENNQAARNGKYDIELTGDTYRFGFLTPLAYNNTVRASAGQKVKDCGRNNIVTGGTLVNNATDPCN